MVTISTSFLKQVSFHFYMSFELRINEKILSILKENKELNILAISSSLDMDRHTVAKYLEVLRTKGLVTFSTKGKSKLWRLSDNSFTELLGVNDFISNQVLELFSNLDYEVSVQSKNYDVVWNNKNKEGGKCYRVLKGKETKCKHCAVKGTPQYLLHVHEPEHEKCKACGEVILEDHLCTMTYHRMRCGKAINEVDYGKHMKGCVKCLRSSLDHIPIVLAPTDSDEDSSDDE